MLQGKLLPGPVWWNPFKGGFAPTWGAVGIAVTRGTCSWGAAAFAWEGQQNRGTLGWRWEAVEPPRASLAVGPLLGASFDQPRILI